MKKILATSVLMLATLSALAPIIIIRQNGLPGVPATYQAGQTTGWWTNAPSGHLTNMVWVPISATNTAAPRR